MTITPVNSVAIPPQFVAVAREYYGGINDLLYAVSSSGGLTTGTYRPWIDCDNRSASDEEWYWMLWSELVGCIDYAREAVKFNIDNADRGENVDEYLDDLEVLDDFAAYAKQWADRLEAEYDIQI